MTNPISVLLIIGSAVVGPIEAQPTVDVFSLPGGYAVSGLNMFAMNGQELFPGRRFPEAYVARVENCKARSNKTTFQCMADVDRNADGIPLETLPQLCERAMREIGAHPFRDSVHASWVDWERVLKTNAVQVPYDIRCIPTPTGYRK